MADADRQDRVVRGLAGLADQGHVGLGRGASAFAAVAAHAAAHQVLPTGSAALGARHDVVEAEFLGGKSFAAVLAAVVVAGKDVAAVELGFAPRHAVVVQEPDDPRHREVQTHGADPFVRRVAAVLLCVLGPGLADLGPVGKVVGPVAAVIDLDHLGHVAGDHGEGPPRINHTHRNPELVQHQHVAIESRRRGGHRFGFPGGWARQRHGSGLSKVPATGLAWGGAGLTNPPAGPVRSRPRTGVSTRPAGPATFLGPGECQSGQLGRAVNPLAYAYAGSNPASPTAHTRVERLFGD